MSSLASPTTRRTTWSGVRLETRADVDRHWQRTVDWWKKGRKAEKAIYVVRYDGFALNCARATPIPPPHSPDRGT